MIGDEEQEELWIEAIHKVCLAAWKKNQYEREREVFIKEVILYNN